MTRIVVLSDIHLSPTHGFFWENWCVAREFANATKADAVIVNGDLAINGPDSDAEIAFAATALASLRMRVMALPGNHDVGDEPPGQDPDQIIDASRWPTTMRLVIDRITARAERAMLSIHSAPCVVAAKSNRGL
jgi:3',5'-cyclic AMP phosphodiesterase CpdA